MHLHTQNILPKTKNIANEQNGSKWPSLPKRKGSRLPGTHFQGAKNRDSPPEKGDSCLETYL